MLTFRVREAENRIIDRRHDALKLLMNGNHLRKIRNPKTALDLACGTGAWTVDIAREFATADEVVGVDLKPIKPFQHPANCRFEVVLIGEYC